MSHYPQLTREERYQIYALKTAGQAKVQIAKPLGRHQATIGWEMARNCGLRGYRPKQADSLALNRRQENVSHRISPQARARVEQLPASIGAQNKSVAGYRKQKTSTSVPSGFSNTSCVTSAPMVTSTATCAVRNNVRSVTVPRIVVVKSKSACPLMIVKRLLPLASHVKTLT